jgi:hypothetical protein
MLQTMVVLTVMADGVAATDRGDQEVELSVAYPSFDNEVTLAAGLRATDRGTYEDPDYNRNKQTSTSIQKDRTRQEVNPNQNQEPFVEQIGTGKTQGRAEPRYDPNQSQGNILLMQSGSNDENIQNIKDILVILKADFPKKEQELCDAILGGILSIFDKAEVSDRRELLKSVLGQDNLDDSYADDVIVDNIVKRSLLNALNSSAIKFKEEGLINDNLCIVNINEALKNKTLDLSDNFEENMMQLTGLLKSYISSCGNNPSIDPSIAKNAESLAIEAINAKNFKDLDAVFDSYLIHYVVLLKLKDTPINNFFDDSECVIEKLNFLFKPKSSTIVYQELAKEIRSVIFKKAKKILTDGGKILTDGGYKLKKAADNLSSIYDKDSLIEAVREVLKGLNVDNLSDTNISNVFGKVLNKKIENQDFILTLIEEPSMLAVAYSENVTSVMGDIINELFNSESEKNTGSFESEKNKLFKEFGQKQVGFQNNAASGGVQNSAAPVTQHSNIYTHSSENMNDAQHNGILATAKNPNAGQQTTVVANSQQAAQPPAQGGQQAGPKKTISEVFAEVKAVDSRLKNTISLKIHSRLFNYMKKAGTTLAKKVKFASENPDWLAALRVWNDYLVQQVADLKGQKPTPKTKSAIKKLEQMIKLAKPVLDKMGNVPVVAEPKEVNGVALPAKLTRKQILDAKKKARLEAILAKKEQKRLRLEDAKKQKAAAKAKGKATAKDKDLESKDKPKDKPKAAKGEVVAVSKAAVPVVVAGKAQATSSGAA